jgi:tight adherence protein C
VIGAGALLGLLAGAGVLLVVFRLPIIRRVRLADRVAPPQIVIGSSPGVRARRDLLGLAAARLDRIVGGRAALARRLDACGERLTIEEYRTSQVLWAACAALPGAAVMAFGALSAKPSVSIAGAALVIAGIAGGVAARDSRLSRQIKQRDAAMLAELPAVADLFALAVTAGESPLGALQRVARGGGGPLRGELGRVVDDVREGTALVAALDAFAARTSVTALARFLDGLVVAVERGTPLADVLRAQAGDVRESAKRQLMEAGGRKEIAMMVPVVFLVLPVVVVFAAYPAFASLTFVTH